MNRCPSTEEVQRLLDEVAESPEARDFESHLEGCANCQAAIEALTTGATAPDDGPPATVLVAGEIVRRPTRFSSGAGPPLGSAQGEEGPLPTVDGYEVQGHLGSGGMGVVYRARHLELGRVVALKMIRSGIDATGEEMARFRGEAQALARLQHPNIVQIHEVGSHNGRPFFALELCDGGSLAGRLKGAPQPPLESARLVETLAHALHAVHRERIVHRDLKPANVLLASDGTPKVTDFGLAKNLVAINSNSQPHENRTRSGAIMGTPSYMAPEQAAGESGQAGPAADTYSLGAILYECLTGRPPFRGPTDWDTVRQVIADEPVPPTRFQPGVPRDLETITLKCLEKRPEHRYASAADLAEDLRRFQGGEPIQARRAGWGERFLKWTRRRPTVAALWALGLGAGLALTVVGAWAIRTGAERHADRALQRGELRGSVEAALEKVGGRIQQAQWAEARAILDQAEDRLGSEGDADLRASLDQARSNLDLVDRLDAARMGKGVLVQGKFDYLSAYLKYNAAFREAGLAAESDDAASVAERIRASAIRDHLAAIVDDWAGTADRPRRAWLLEVARQVDPSDERNRFRDPAVWENARELVRLTTEVRSTALPPALLAVLGDQLKKRRIDPVPFLTRAIQAHPSDFWLNLHLGNNLTLAGRGAAAVEYFRAATVIRPDVAAALVSLGGSLVESQRPEEAVGILEKAIELDPQFAGAYANLGAAFGEMGRPREALAALDRAAALNPGDYKIHYNRGLFLSDLKHEKEATDAYRQALQLAPKLAAAHHALGDLHAGQSAVTEALLAYRQALTYGPRSLKTQHALGALLLRQGRSAEAIPHLQEATRLAPGLAPPHHNLGLALASQGRFDEALAAYQRAAHCDPGLGQAHYNVGWCQLRKGRPEVAAEAFRRSLGCDPKDAETHKALVQSLLRQGQFPQARVAVRHALEQLPPMDPARNSLKILGDHCDALIKGESLLPDLVRGMRRPGDAAEALLWAQLCRYKQVYATACRFYTEAFVADIHLAGQENHGDHAACCAVLASGGHGKDSLLLEAKERIRLRAQALTWLQADLARWTSHARQSAPEARSETIKVLLDWQNDSDLTDVRDPASLTRLSKTEQAAWREFWAEVGNVWKQVHSLAGSG